MLIKFLSYKLIFKRREAEGRGGEDEVAYLPARLVPVFWILFMVSTFFVRVATCLCCSLLDCGGDGSKPFSSWLALS